MNSYPILSKLGGRKFLLALGAGAATTFLQWDGKLDPAGLAYVAVIGSTVGAFIVGNVVQNKHEIQERKSDSTY